MEQRARTGIRLLTRLVGLVNAKKLWFFFLAFFPVNRDMLHTQAIRTGNHLLTPFRLNRRATMQAIKLIDDIFIRVHAFPFQKTVFSRKTAIKAVFTVEKSQSI